MLRRLMTVSGIAVVATLVGCGGSSGSDVAPSDAGLASDGDFGSDGSGEITSDAGSGDAPIPAVGVTLTASRTQVTAAGSITLTATATAPGATVGKLEFYEGTTLLATKNASPATFDVSFVEGDNGTHTYTAKAYTPADNATSAPLDVTVAIPMDPCGVDRTRCIATGCSPGLCLSPSHVPSGFGAWSRSRGIRDVMLTGSVGFDTKTGALGGVRAANTDATIYEVISGIGFVRTHQVGSEPDLAIWVFSSLTTNGIVATFSGDAAAVLAVAKDATISGGRFDVAAKGQLPGPGGFLGGLYAADGLGCAFGRGTSSGGGGGGFGSDGAQGGSGAGGLALTCDAYGELLSLRGGSGGGGGDDSDSAATSPFGGAGGGAIQITAFGALSFDAVVQAGGGGGRTSQGNSRSGAGGGSGGAIFLESPSITIGASSGLYANGGGGGSSSPGTGGICGSPAAAQDGQASLVPATGSHCGSGYGGDGAAAAIAAKPGTSIGGGGGGLGRIVLRTLSSATPVVSTTNLSPAPGSTAYRVAQNL